MQLVDLKNDYLTYVIEGSLHLETDGELIIVPKGIRHRPVVKELAKFLMIELEGTLNKENSGNLYED